MRLFGWVGAILQKDKTRPYHVRGKIGFQLKRHDDVVNVANFQRAVYDGVNKIVWGDTDHPGIYHDCTMTVSEGERQMNAGYAREVVWWFTVEPPKTLRRSQLCAFEKYLHALGEEIVKDMPADAAQVRCVCVVMSEACFYRK